MCHECHLLYAGNIYSELGSQQGNTLCVGVGCAVYLDMQHAKNGILSFFVKLH